MRYTEAANAEEFLRHVLKNWISWQKVNTGIFQAIADLMDENESLKAELEEIKKNTDCCNSR